MSEQASPISPVSRSTNAASVAEADGIRPGIQTYALAGLVEPLQYRVFWKNEWTRKFTLTPTKPIQFSKVSVRVIPPSYIGGGSELSDALPVQGLAGSEVQIQARTSKKLNQARLLFNDGREKDTKKTGDRDFYVDFFIEKGLIIWHEENSFDKKINEKFNKKV